MRIDVNKFNESKEYREELLNINNSLCMKGIDKGLNEEEEALRREINQIVNDYYFKR